MYLRACVRVCVRVCNLCDKIDLFHFELSQTSEVGRIDREAFPSKVDRSWFADMWPD